MALSLNTIKSAKGTSQKRKRVGRGNSSGSGTYSGRGLKGQKARSGVSGLKRLGMKQTLLRTPKSRGFRSMQEKPQVINLSDLNKYYSEGQTVDAASLKKLGLIKDHKRAVKVLGLGELKIKKLVFKNIDLSKSALEKIEKAQGKVENKKKDSKK